MSGAGLQARCAQGIVVGIAHRGLNMSTRYEYRVCQLQQAKVTFVNGAWAGNRPMDPARVEESLATCSTVWDYLYDAGREGWKLVATSVVPQSTPYEVLYLKRVVS